MDLPSIWVGNYKLDYDLLLDSEHWFHKCLGKDLCIFDWYKLDSMDTRNLWHIQVYMLVDYPHILERKSKQPGCLLPCIDCLDHKEKDCMDFLELALKFVYCRLLRNAYGPFYWEDILSTTLQATNAFPLKPRGQLHIGMWFTTRHSAFSPQVPGQGSAHLLLIQALVFGQSLFKTHSGLQPR